MCVCKGRFTIYARASVVRLPALHCNQKCNLDAHRNTSQRLNITYFYSSIAMRCDVRPNHFYALPVATQCRQLRYACSCIYCEPALNVCVCVCVCVCVHYITIGMFTQVCVHEYVLFVYRSIKLVYLPILPELYW